MRKQGVWGKAWGRCERCNFPFPVDMLTKQKGMLLCGRDLDATVIERRAQQIAQVLSQGEEFKNLLAETQEQDDTFELEL